LSAIPSSCRPQRETGGPPSQRGDALSLRPVQAPALAAADSPALADSVQVNEPLVVGILSLLVMSMTIVYGPIAAALVTVMIGLMFIRDRKDADLHG